MKPKEMVMNLVVEDLETCADLVDANIEYNDLEYLIDHEVFAYLDQEWHLATKIYSLNSSGLQKAFGQMAILAGGIEVAREKDRQSVGIDELKEGWERQTLVVCGMGVPPHKCIGKSIIQKSSEIMRQEGIASRILSESFDNADDQALIASNFDTIKIAK